MITQFLFDFDSCTFDVPYKVGPIDGKKVHAKYVLRVLPLDDKNRLMTDMMVTFHEECTFPYPATPGAGVQITPCTFEYDDIKMKNPEYALWLERIILECWRDTVQKGESIQISSSENLARLATQKIAVNP